MLYNPEMGGWGEGGRGRSGGGGGGGVLHASTQEGGQWFGLLPSMEGGTVWNDAQGRGWRLGVKEVESLHAESKAVVY